MAESCPSPAGTQPARDPVPKAGGPGGVGADSASPGPQALRGQALPPPQAAGGVLVSVTVGSTPQPFHTMFTVAVPRGPV